MGDLIQGRFPGRPWTTTAALEYLGVPLYDEAGDMRPADVIVVEAINALFEEEDGDLRQTLSRAIGGKQLENAFHVR